MVEVSEGILDYLGAACAAEEEGGFGVFGSLGGFFVEGTLAACVTRFAVIISILHHIIEWG